MLFWHLIEIKHNVSEVGKNESLGFESSLSVNSWTSWLTVRKIDPHECSLLASVLRRIFFHVPSVRGFFVWNGFSLCLQPIEGLWVTKTLHEKVIFGVVIVENPFENISFAVSEWQIPPIKARLWRFSSHDSFWVFEIWNSLVVYSWNLIRIHGCM